MPKNLNSQQEETQGAYFVGTSPRGMVGQKESKIQENIEFRENRQHGFKIFNKPFSESLPYRIKLAKFKKNKLKPTQQKKPITISELGFDSDDDSDDYLSPQKIKIEEESDSPMTKHKHKTEQFRKIIKLQQR